MGNAIPDEVPPRSFAEALASGRLPWELFAAFPEPDPERAAAGEEFLAEFGPFIDARVDGDEFDRTGVWPEGLLRDLRERGDFQLTAPLEFGGRGMSRYEFLRVAARASRRAMGVGQMLCVQNLIAGSALLPAVPPGPLHDFLSAEIAAGSISGFGDTDPAGQNNRLPATTATLTEDGSAYRLRGDKLFIANAGLADVLGVSATVDGPDGPCAGVFFLTTSEPGFEVLAPSQFIGVNGLSASFRLNDVCVPRERAIIGDGAARLPRAVALQGLHGRTAFGASGSMAVIANCLDYSAEFLLRRRVDGRSLAEYDEIQRITAFSLAAEYAVESAVRWTMLDGGPEDRIFELYITKNLATELAWRVSDRTVALLGGEGIETAESKRRRGAVPHPVERYHRDARVLRTVGNVDFANDLRAGTMLLDRYRAGASGGVGAASSAASSGTSGTSVASGPAQTAELSEPNRRHLNRTAFAIRDLHRSCQRLAENRDGQAGPAAWQEPVILVGRLATELFGICAVLGRAAQDGDAAAQDLADVYVTEAAFRVADLARRLAAEQEPAAPDYAKISRAWLTTREPS